MAKAPYQTPEDQIPVKLKEAAKRSGKPLEVVCARSFLETRIHASSGENELKESWKVYLNSYYHDGISNKMRELDVLARRQRYVPVSETTGFNCVLESLMSCKGFPSEDHLITFSVRRTVDVNPEDPPIIPANISIKGDAFDIGKLAAEAMLYFMSDMNSGKAYDVRRTVGFDLVKDPREVDKDWISKGDRTFFESVDGVLQASFFWKSIHLPAFKSPNEGLLRVQVPVMVFLRPWYEIAIDGGTMSDLVMKDLSFTANLYPMKGERELPVSLFTLLISRERLPDLQKALGNLYCRMWDWAKDAYENRG